MIVRIKRDLRPGLVLISGDLTKDGEQVSHEYVTSKLDELRAIGIKTLVIPGNHDRGSNSDAVYYDGESTTAATVATNEWFAKHYANYGYGAGSEREGTTLTYACERVGNDTQLGGGEGYRCQSKWKEGDCHDAPSADTTLHGRGQFCNYGCGGRLSNST